MSDSIGRKEKDRYVNTIADRSAEQGILVKQDEIIDALKAIAAKLDADVGVTDTDYASAITDLIEKVQLNR